METKIFAAGIFLLLVLNLFPGVLAQEGVQEELTEEKIAQDTMSEVFTMGQKLGAEIRLLQLEKSITRNIIVGDQVILKLKEEGKNTTELEVLITELEALKLEIQNLNPEDEDAVERFVNIKHDAIEITKEFREISRDLLDKGDRLEIAEKIKEMDKNELNQYNERIRNKIRVQNAEIIRKIFDSLGIENEELLTRIESGNATYAEVRNEIRNAIERMTPEERREAWGALKESGVRKDIAVRARIEKARLNINKRRAILLDYLKKASEKIQDPERKARVQNAIEKRSDIIQRRIDTISNRLEKTKEIRENIIERRRGGRQE